MTLLADFRRVSRQRPCPVCEHPDWCLVSRDDPPSKVICARVESSRRWGEAGWLHRFRDDERPRMVRTMRTVRVEMRPGGVSSTDLERLTNGYIAAASGRINTFASSLGVTVGSLQRLRAGWTGRFWSFPMVNAGGETVGIRLRGDGCKLSVRGGREGLFVPTDLRVHGTLFIAEGPTDTAALLDLGFDGIGRPSCVGGSKIIIGLLRRLGRPEVVVVADGDGPGQRGAGTLGTLLRGYSPAVRVITPPRGIKDARDWRRAGATREDILAAVHDAPVQRGVMVARPRTRNGATP